MERTAERDGEKGKEMRDLIKETAWRGDARPTETGTTARAAVVVSPAILPQKPAGHNTQRRATWLLLDKTIERQDYHDETAEECRRAIRYYTAALGWHAEQADRARAIRAELERMVAL